MEKGVLTVVSGFAGSGKGTVMKSLLSGYDGYALSISATTRSPRPGEQDGVDYFFKTEEDFAEMVRRGEFLEHASYVGNSYGTPAFYVDRMLNEGRDVILEIEIQGALQVRKMRPDTLLVFLTPPSAKELENRLKGRGTEPPEVIRRRMKRAAEESEFMPEYDYILVNDAVEQTAERLHAIIQSRHSAAAGKQEFIAKMQKELRNYQ